MSLTTLLQKRLAEKKSVALLVTLSKWYLHVYPAQPFNRPMEEINEAAKLYPQIVPFVHEVRDRKLCPVLFKESDLQESLSEILMLLNNEYINSVGCDCGKPIILDSDEHRDFYAHYAHPVFIRWAFAHLSLPKRQSILEKGADIAAIIEDRRKMK